MKLRRPTHLLVECKLRTLFAALIISMLSSQAVVRPLNAQEAQLNEQILKKAKHATVQLRVKLSNDNISEGSGWFAFEPGLVITNAHVVGMVDADSRRPQAIEVVIDSGETNSRKVPAKLLGIDRTCDLAVLKAEGADLPEPLELGQTNDLLETKSVFIFGFPYRDKIGKNITVSKSSVSSLRKENGTLTQIQVNGGMHPGNSGGPVIDGKGQVIGVAVAAIQGTQINFAIPIDEVKEFLNGRVISISVDHSYISGDKIKVPVRLSLDDPLGRVKDLKIDYWVAPMAKSRLRPGGFEQPQPLPGDSPITTRDVDYDGKGAASIEVDAQPLTDPKLSYWFRPAYRDGSNTAIWHRSVGNLRPNPVERKEVTLKFEPKQGKAPPIELSGDSTFQVRVGAAKPDVFAMHLKVIMNPTVLPYEPNQMIKMGLNYSSFTIGMKVNGEVLKNSDRWRTVGQNMLKTTALVEFENDGSVNRSQPDLRRAAKDEQESLKTITENLLQSLDIFYVPLPNGPIQPGAVIKVQRDLSVGLPGMFVPAQAVLKYQYLGMRTVLNARPTALFEVTGSIRGRRGDGLNVGGGVSGKLDVLQETGVVILASTNVKTDLDIVDEGKQTRLTGSLAMQLRPAPPPKPAAPKAVEPGEPIDSEANLEADTMLMAEKEGKWLPVKVVTQSSEGDVKIHWEGLAESMDEDVPRARLRFPKK